MLAAAAACGTYGSHNSPTSGQTACSDSLQRGEELVEDKNSACHSMTQCKYNTTGCVDTIASARQGQVHRVGVCAGQQAHSVPRARNCALGATKQQAHAVTDCLLMEKYPVSQRPSLSTGDALQMPQAELSPTRCVWHLRGRGLCQSALTEAHATHAATTHARATGRWRWSGCCAMAVVQCTGHCVSAV